MLRHWQCEGVGTQHVKIKTGAMPGLYIIENDNVGERSFAYWRDHSAAKSLFSDYPEVFDDLANYEYLFLSGISLSLYSDASLVALFSFLRLYRSNGGKVVFDNNYRPRNWLNPEAAINTFQTMMQHTDIALISFDDEISLYGEHHIDACVERWVNPNSSISELVIKNGQYGCYAFQNDELTFLPLNQVVKPIDTTAAGDSFNGAYLAKKLAGKSISECVKAGQFCAANVIMHKGAIIDKAINLLEQEAV
jgi:2-dehydro-3-deoxygluconokinase